MLKYQEILVITKKLILLLVKIATPNISMACKYGVLTGNMSWLSVIIYLVYLYISIIVSDRCFEGKATDKSGPNLIKLLTSAQE